MFDYCTASKLEQEPTYPAGTVSQQVEYTYRVARSGVPQWLQWRRWPWWLWGLIALAAAGSVVVIIWLLPLCVIVDC
jgi:hypothetical protein